LRQIITSTSFFSDEPEAELPAKRHSDLWQKEFRKRRVEIYLLDALYLFVRIEANKAHFRSPII
jgi:hypothetical protein